MQSLGGADNYPLSLANFLWFWWFLTFDPLAVASDLALAFLLASRRLPVSLSPHSYGQPTDLVWLPPRLHIAGVEFFVVSKGREAELQ